MGEGNIRETGGCITRAVWRVVKFVLSVLSLTIVAYVIVCQFYSTDEEKAIKALLRNSRLKVAELAKVLGVKKRQAERVISSLKVKAGLKRRGADKNGEWYF